MAEESSFLGVIERLKAEGLLNRNSGSNSIKSLKQINQDGFNSLSVQMGELIDFFKGNALQDEENRRELLKALKDGKKEEKKEEKKVESGGFKIDGLEGILAVLTAGITGLVGGIIAGAAGQVAKILKLDKLGKALKGITGSVNRFVKSGKLFTKFKNGVKLFSSSISTFIKNTKIFKGLSKVTKSFRSDFRKAFKPVAGIFKAIPKAFGSIGGLIGKVIPGGGRGLKTLFDPLKSFFKTFGKAAPKFFALGKVLGRLFLPITVIFGAIDAIKGAMGGFEKYKDEGLIEGLIGGFFGAIGGLLEGFIGLPLDLLKSAISFVAGKLGFENFAEMLDSFSFKELIGGLFTKVTDIVVGFIGSIRESIANIGVGGLIKNISLDLLKIFKKIATFPVAVVAGGAAALAAALPGGKTPVDAFKEGFSAVFNAGDAAIDSFKTTNNTGAQMEVGMSNIADAESQPAAVVVEGGGSVPQSTNVNAPSVTVQNSAHIDESFGLIQPSYSYAPAYLA